jgi:hypothetical protein
LSKRVKYMRVGSFRSRENGHLEGEVLEEEGVDLPAEPR